MLKSFKGRTIKVGQEVLVYFNLHEKVFSIKDAETGLVISHGNNIVVESPEFIVNEKSRLKVLETQQKNVHAFVKGIFAGITKNEFNGANRVHYNPYTQDKFTVSSTGTDANHENYSKAVLTDKKIFTF